MPDTLPGVLRAAAEEFGDHPAFVEGDDRTTFAELLARVQATARGYASLGFDRGDRLVLWGPNSIDWVVAALATSYAGGVLIPANSRYTAHEVADIVERTDAKLVVVADGFLDRTQMADLAPLVPGRTLLDITALPTDGPDVEDRADAVAPDDVADILFTSGTTGRPKGAMSAHRQTIGVSRAWAEVAGIRPDDRYLVVNPFFHSFGYKIGIVVGLLTGATLYPVATFDVEQTLDLIERERVTVFPGAPAIFQALLAADRSGHDLGSLRLAVTGAAMIPVVLIERMKDELGFDDVLTAFGMTEAVVVTMCRQGDDAETIATTSGRAIPGMEVRIGSANPEGEGELLVRGDHVMLGYLDDPDATAVAIDADRWLHTGDVGSLDDAGNLRITDRLKDMYISGGFNVYPAEVEQALLRAEGVQDIAVIGVPDERMGEVGKAFIVGPATPDELREFAKQRLANFKIPRYIETVEALPRNLSGKVLKNELRSRS
ncbi:MAG TPA: FadD3 family acyl-CoA ligase [Aeromicrobium sp.]|nr:FadD3 family acyl-CoA ligase [Aeromicrobium sp.]